MSAWANLAWATGAWENNAWEGMDGGGEEEEATSPGAPTSVVGTPGDTTVSVTGIAPASDGGATITGYVADDGLGGHTTAEGPLPRVLTGLTNGVAITPRLAAVNSVGQGAWASGAAVTPRTVPGAPTIGTLTPNLGNGTMTITFTPPVSNGGAPVLYYTAVSSAGGVSRQGPTSPITILEPVQGVLQTVTVIANNEAGNGAASSASNAVTPSGRSTGGSAPIRRSPLKFYPVHSPQKVTRTTRKRK